MHRDLPIDLQARHLLAMNQCQDILIGNCFAADEELKTLADLDLTKITVRVNPVNRIRDSVLEQAQ